MRLSGLCGIAGVSMAFDYSQFLDMGQEMIAEYGAQAIFRHPVQTYNPVAGKPVESVQDMRARAVLSSPDEKALAGGTVQIGDGMLLVSGKELANEPMVNDRVVFGGREWLVVSVGRVAPDAGAILYKVYIRRA